MAVDLGKVAPTALNFPGYGIQKTGKPELVEIVSTPALADQSVIATLAAHGVAGNRDGASEPGRLMLRLAGAVPFAPERILAALGDVISARGLRLIAERVGNDSFFVRPPAA